MTALPPIPIAASLHGILQQAGDIALARLRDHTVRYKDDGSKVTDADEAANEVIVSALAQLFPHDRILSEEAEPVGPEDADAVWYVDPIDGTGAYTEGLAHWGPTVARATHGVFDVGAFLQPRLSEFWFAGKGQGAWRDGTRLRPLEPGPSASARTLYVPSRAHHLPAMPWHGKIRALGSSAAHLALVSGGGAAATVIPAWKPWDVGCGILLVEESGRVVTDLSGRRFDPMKAPGTPLVAAARSVLDDLLVAIADTLDRTRPDASPGS